MVIKLSAVHPDSSLSPGHLQLEIIHDLNKYVKFDVAGYRSQG